MEGKKKSLVESFNSAIKGIISALKSERNLRIHFTAAILVLLASLLLKISKIEFLILLIVITIVIVSELFNTVTERVIDLITDRFHPLAKLAKDISAGAVLISSISSVIIGYIIFFKHPFLLEIRDPVILRIKRMPHYITFSIIIFLAFFVIFLKGITGKEKFISGGFPSGHTAFAFSVATLTFFTSKNFLLFILTLILAVMVGESRIRLGIHSLSEVIAGAIFGILITTLLFQIFG